MIIIREYCPKIIDVQPHLIVRLGQLSRNHPYTGRLSINSSIKFIGLAQGFKRHIP